MADLWCGFPREAPRNDGGCDAPPLLIEYIERLTRAHGIHDFETNPGVR